MKGRVINILAGVSFVLMLAAAAAWARSYLPEHVWLRWVDGQVVIVAADGTAALGLGEGFLDPHPGGGQGVRAMVSNLRRGWPPWVDGSFRMTPAIAPVRTTALGVEVFTMTTPPTKGQKYRIVFVPAWYPFLAAAVVPVVWLVGRLRRRRRSGPGRCRRCSYDLTGNTSGVCPECGTPVELADVTTGAA